MLTLLNGEPLDEWRLRDRTARFGYAWARTARENPRLALEALSRFVALLSSARDPESDERRPLLHIEAHLWVRPVGRALSGVGARPEFQWYEDERAAARKSALLAAPSSEDASDDEEWPASDSRQPLALPGSDTVQRPAQATFPRSTAVPAVVRGGPHSPPRPIPRSWRRARSGSGRQVSGVTSGGCGTSSRRPPRRCGTRWPR